MGCTNTKDAGVSNQSNPLEFTPKEIVDSRPDTLRRDITETYKWYSARREKIKPLLAERYGVNTLIDEEREKLVMILQKKDVLFTERAPYLRRIFERDAEEIHRAFQKFSTDKSVIVNILCARTYWQIDEIGRIYQEKFGTSLLERVVNEMTTMLGSLLTGSGTGLSKLLSYRILPQADRDAALLRDCTDGMSLDDAGLLEVICTRTNAELRSAMEIYSRDYKKDLVEVVKSKSSYKNYREFVLKILECNRDEDDQPFETHTAKRYADELYAAGAARSIGFEPEPFIRILSNVNRKQYESINEQYPNKALIKDITAKLGGDFQLAVLTRCADKFEFLANRLEVAVKGFSTDKETISRILGCLSRPDCVRVKLAYNRMGFKRTLDEALRSVLKSQNSFLNGCLLLISEDLAITPTGSDKELYEEELDNSREAERLANAEYATYKQEKIVERGAQVMQRKRRAGKKFRLLSTGGNSGATSGETSENTGAPGTTTGGAGDSQIPQSAEEKNNEAEDGATKDVSRRNSDDSITDSPDPILIEEDRVLSFEWDGKGRFLDAAKLTAIFRELEAADNQTQIMLDRLPDEINALKSVYKTILKHRFETECFNRSYAAHIRSLKEFINLRDRLAVNNTSSGGFSIKKN